MSRKPLLALALAFVASCAAAQTNNFNVLDGSPLSATSVRIGDGSAAAPSFALTSATSTGFYKGSFGFSYSNGGAASVAFGGGFQLGSGGVVQWNSVASADGAGADTVLTRDGIGVLALKNGAVTQEFRLYRNITGPLYVALRAATPTIGACGTSPSLVGADSAMQLTVGTGGVATSCAASFSANFANAPTCVASSNNTADAALAVSTTISAVTVTKAAALTASSVIHVICMGR